MARDPGAGPGAHAAIKPGGWGDEMLGQVIGDRAQDRVGLALAIRGSREVFVKAGDGQSDRPDQIFRAALAAHGVLLQEGGEFFSPKTFRKGGVEQLRRGFVQSGNGNKPLPTPGYQRSLILNKLLSHIDRAGLTEISASDFPLFALIALCFDRKGTSRYFQSAGPKKEVMRLENHKNANWGTQQIAKHGKKRIVIRRKPPHANV